MMAWKIISDRSGIFRKEDDEEISEEVVEAAKKRLGRV